MHGRGLAVAKRLSLFLTVFYIVMVLTCFIAAIFVLINLGTKWINFAALSPWKALGLVLAVGILATVLPGLMTYFLLPRRYDKELAIRNRLPEEGEGADRARVVNMKLRSLQESLRRWRGSGLIRRHGDVFVTEKLESNAFTYGNFDRARIVFAADLLECFTIAQLESILAHEVGHMEENDYITLCLFAEITKILNWINMPFMLLANVISFIFNILSKIPLALFSFTFQAIGFLVRLLLRAISLPLWLPRALLFWESQLAEFLADDFGVALSGSASGLITALMRLENRQIEIRKKKGKKSGRYDLFATVVEHSEGRENNSALADTVQFLEELESSHPQSVLRWKRLAHLAFQDERIL